MFITLDGVVEAPQKWNPPYYDDEMSEAVQAQLAIPTAELMCRTPKIVVSTTLTNADWGPAKIISGDIAMELARLKQQPGKNIKVGARRKAPFRTRRPARAAAPPGLHDIHRRGRAALRASRPTRKEPTHATDSRGPVHFA